MFNGAKRMAAEAKFVAENAEKRANEVMGELRQHVKECVENQRSAAVWRGEVKTILTNQNEDATAIKKFLGKILGTALGTLIVVIAFMVYYGVKGIHP